MLPMSKLTEPVLVSDTDCAALVVPTAWPLNVRLDADSVAIGDPPIPVPVR